MTNAQIAWAAQHDWFITRHYIRSNAVVVRDDMHADGYQTFDNYSKLRRWAGY